MLPTLKKFVCITVTGHIYELLFITSRQSGHVAATDFPIHSNFQISTPIKYGENSSFEAHKWLMKSFLLASVSLLGQHFSKLENMPAILRYMILCHNSNLFLKALTL
jgi:hypothetical protein